jgi:hypothetical protein
MSETTVKTVFKSLMENIKKSKYPLAPLHEAIANSLEAILQKENFVKGEKVEINITFDYSGLVEDKKSLQQITVQDNGFGFDPLNFARFETLLDKSKGFNNRGSGRIQFVHRFDRVEVVSYYTDNGEHFKRMFSCTAARFVHNKQHGPDAERHKSGSTLTFIAGDSLERDREYFDNLDIADIVRDLKRQLMLRYYLESQKPKNRAPVINIAFTKNGEKTASASIKPEDMPAPAEKGSVRVQHLRLKHTKTPSDIEWEPVPGKDETLDWAHFKIPENDLESNGVWLCSKGVTVSPLTYDAINKHGTVKGNRFLTVFYGKTLDKPENVSDSVDSFQFPAQKEIEAKIRDGDLFLPGDEFLFYDNIKKEINAAIPGIYKDVIDVQKSQDNRVEEIAREHGISLEIARKANIKLNDTPVKITEKLYKEQADHLSRESLKIRKVFNDLKTLNPTSETYQEELHQKSTELLGLIPQQNKEELGRYIIRRDMVAEVLRKILAQELEYQKSPAKPGVKKSPEGLIHDLIFRRKAADSGQLNDLWILNEEYVHYAGCSDLPINQIVDEKGQPLLKPISAEKIAELGLKPELRPDIFLYPEEGKCVLVELKAPDVNLAEHLNQMTKYCNLIANYSVRKIQKFYCYLIGETVNPLTDFDGTYEETVAGDWIGPNVPVRTMDKERTTIATLQIEVSKLSSIYTRAHRRNKSFADKLGLRELLKEPAKP